MSNKSGARQPTKCIDIIQLLKSPIPAAAAPAPAPSQKASSDDISGTKRGTIDPLVSKRPEKNSESENLKKKNVENCKNW